MKIIFNQNFYINKNILKLLLFSPVLPERLPGELTDTVPFMCPGSSPGPPACGTCPGGNEIPKLPQLASLNMEEQWIYFKLLPRSQSPPLTQIQDLIFLVVSQSSSPIGEGRIIVGPVSWGLYLLSQFLLSYNGLLLRLSHCSCCTCTSHSFFHNI